MGILLPMLILGGAGLVAAVILFIVAKRFAVYEDERIAQVEALLPGANCGACGRKGCHDFAVACCEAKSLDGLRCPGAGDAGMAAIAELLGFTVGRRLWAHKRSSLRQAQCLRPPPWQCFVRD